MRPVTKVILVLSLIAVAVVVLLIASRQFNASGTKPAVAGVGSETGDRGAYSDSRATLQRWRSYLSGDGRSGAAGRDEGPARPDGKAPPAARRPRHPDLDTSSRDEGTVAARGSDEAVAGADPPGPALRPDGLIGEIVRGPLRTRASEDANAYTIAAGDTLSGIASRRYGSTRYVQTIQDANPGLDPNRLRVGERIRLPDVSKLAEGASAPAAPAPKVYVVQQGDTLIRIAQRIYGEASMYPRIYEANKDILSSPNARLYIGQRLRLPEPN